MSKANREDAEEMAALVQRAEENWRDVTLADVLKYRRIVPTLAPGQTSVEYLQIIGVATYIEKAKAGEEP